MKNGKNGWNLALDGFSQEFTLINRDEFGNAHFVARFKYARPKTNARAFARFLVANFTPLQYFAELDAGKAPLTILKARGFVSPNELEARQAALRG